MVYTIGVPLWTYVTLTRSRHKLYSNAKFEARYGFLYIRYEPKYYWFEMLEMARKITLLCVAMFISPGTMKQICFCLLVAIMYMVIHVKLQPFEEDMDDNLQSMTLIATFLTISCAALIKTGEGGTDVTAFILLVNLVVFAVAIYELMDDTLPAAIDDLKGITERIAEIGTGSGYILEDEEDEEAKDEYSPFNLSSEVQMLEKVCCSVCGMHDVSESNPIYTCRRCHVQMHFRCSGNVQAIEYSWQCKQCSIPAESSIEQINNILGVISTKQEEEETSGRLRTKREAREMLADLREQRAAETISEEEYKTQKRMLQQSCQSTKIALGATPSHEFLLETSEVSAVLEKEELPVEVTEPVAKQNKQVVAPSQQISKPEARKMLAELREQRQAGTIGEEEYKAQKRVLQQSSQSRRNDTVLVT